MEGKAVAVDFKFEGSKAIASVVIDSNKDGQPLAKINVELELSEVPDEVLSLIVKKKQEKPEAPAEGPQA